MILYFVFFLLFIYLQHTPVSFHNCNVSFYYAPIIIVFISSVTLLNYYLIIHSFIAIYILHNFHYQQQPRELLTHSLRFNKRERSHASSSCSSSIQKQSHMNHNNKAMSELPFLPNELLLEILSRLPVKSILKFRCVCKSWLYLFSDPYFIKKHFFLSTKNTHFTNHHRIILSATTAEFHLKSCSVTSLFNNQSTISDDLTYPVKNKYRHDGIVGSCNGLLCFAIKGDCVLLWNPSIRVSKKSPPLGNNWRPGCFTCFGLGYDHVSEDFKVVAVFVDPNEFFSESNVKIYSMETNSWRKIQDFPHGFLPYQNSGKFVSGTLNWAANYSSFWVIVSLDLQKETYREVLPPNYEKEECSIPTLGVLKGCLCMNYDYKKTDFVVWSMKDYGVRESWIKLVTIPYLPNPEDFSYSGPYCISENGELLLMFEFDLIIYDPRDHSFRYPKIESGKGWFDAEVYVETLVSPMNHRGL